MIRPASKLGEIGTAGAPADRGALLILAEFTLTMFSLQELLERLLDVVL